MNGKIIKANGSLYWDLTICLMLGYFKKGEFIYFDLIENIAGL